MADYQIAVVGAGPGGYAAALRAAQLGMKAVCVDDRQSPTSDKASLGGTCLNVGCIPSKALLEDSLAFSRARAGHPAFKTASVELDLAALMQRKEQVVEKLCKGIAQLFSGNGVDAIYGKAQLVGPGKLLVDGKAEITADHIVLAPGSVPVEIPVAPFGDRVIDSTAALEMDRVPEKLAVIGAGAIGLELGSAWSRLGAEVTILEALEDFLPALDRDMARLALRSLSGQGLDIRLGCKVTGVTATENEVEVGWEDENGSQSGTFERVIVAVGRRPATDGLLADGCGLELDDRGMIPVDDYCATSLEKVWALGDAVRGPMLAHKATEEGLMVAERIAGEPAEVNYDLIPGVIYTHPEIAFVGRTVADCAARSEEASQGAFAFAANGRALAAGESEGRVKLVGQPVSDRGDMRIVGIQVVGHSAAELVQQAVIAMEFGAVAEDLALTTFSHPTLSECLHEAALDLAGRPLHQVKKRKPGVVGS